MINQLNQFATWLFNSLTTVWNFAINTELIRFFVGYLILNWIVEEYKKYAGK